jgi:hypothetical protein
MGKGALSQTRLENYVSCLKLLLLTRISCTLVGVVSEGLNRGGFLNGTMNSLPRWFGRKRVKQQQKQQQPQQLMAKQRPNNHGPIYAFDEQSYRRWCHSLLHFFQIDTLLSCLFELSYFDYCIAGILKISQTLIYLETRCSKYRKK